MRVLAERIQVDYRGRYKSFMEGVALEAYGNPRPEVIRDFYRWGLLDTAFRRLAAIVKERKLSAAFDKDAVFRAEVEKLSLEIQWFTRPVISGLLLYYTLIEPAYAIYEEDRMREKWENDVKQQPEKYLPKTEKADDDRIRNFDEQIDDLTIQKRQYENELNQHPPLPEAEAKRVRRALDKTNRRISELQELKLDLQRGLTDVHP
jgi:hypothetical protein